MCHSFVWLLLRDGRIVGVPGELVEQAQPQPPKKSGGQSGQDAALPVRQIDHLPGPQFTDFTPGHKQLGRVHVLCLQTAGDQKAGGSPDRYGADPLRRQTLHHDTRRVHRHGRHSFRGYGPGVQNPFAADVPGLYGALHLQHPVVDDIVTGQGLIVQGLSLGDV